MEEGGWSKFSELWRVLWGYHKGKIMGIACGLIVGILFITIGFFRTLVIVLMAGLGGFLGSMFDGEDRLQRLLDRFNRNDRQ